MQASGEAPTDEDEELLKRLDETEKIGEEVRRESSFEFTDETVYDVFV